MLSLRRAQVGLARSFQQIERAANQSASQRRPLEEEIQKLQQPIAHVFILCGGARFSANDPAGRHQYQKPCAGAWRGLQPAAGLQSRLFNNFQIGSLESGAAGFNRQNGELKFAAAR